MRRTCLLTTFVLGIFPAVSPAVETGVTGSGQSLDQATIFSTVITDIPVAGRDYADLIKLSPGVEFSDQNTFDAASNFILIDGASAENALKQIRGGGFADTVTGDAGIGINWGNPYQDLGGNQGGYDIPPRRGDSPIRYTSPTITGFTLGTTWQHDDFWDVALRYAGKIDGFYLPVADHSFNGGGHVGVGEENVQWGFKFDSVKDEWENIRMVEGLLDPNLAYTFLVTPYNYLEQPTLIHPKQVALRDFVIDGRYQIRNWGEGGAWENVDIGWNRSWGAHDIRYDYYWNFDCPQAIETRHLNKMTAEFERALAEGVEFEVNNLNYEINGRSALTVGGYYAATLPSPDFNQFAQQGGFGSVVIARIGDIAVKLDCTAALSRLTAAEAGKAHKPAPDPKARVKRFPNDGFFYSKRSWGQKHDDQWGLKRIGFKSSGRDGKGSLWTTGAGHLVTVAVVDTGVDYGHPELAGSLWVNARDNPNNDQDDDNNQHENDFIGWNFVGDNPVTADDNGHGTFVAGIIAARIDNGIGMVGVNPWAQIMPVKVADDMGHSNSVDVAQGIAYAAHMGARVINVSIAGDTLTPIEQSAIDEAAKAGSLVVVAAGNKGVDTKTISPAGLNGVITVAATGPDDKRAGYSNYGGAVDISAPGSDILSLRAMGTDALLFADEDYQPGSNFVGTNRHYYRLSGTSFAAPYVSGVASLLFALKPKLTAAEVKRMILHSARDIDVPGVDHNTGYGLLDAAAALAADPAFFAEAAIAGVQLVQVKGKQAVQVVGTSDADRFKRAWVEIGAGEEPKKWKRVGKKIAKPVKNGPLTDIETSAFAGAKQWVIRVTTEHKNGRKREARYLLTLG